MFALFVRNWLGRDECEGELKKLGFGPGLGQSSESRLANREG